MGSISEVKGIPSPSQLKAFFDSMDRDEALEKIESALSLDLDYYKRASKPASLDAELKRSAVLIGLDLSDLSVLVIKRAEIPGDRHSGQFGFPGGMEEHEDGGSLVQTALRESEEEVGLDSKFIEVVGQLPRVNTMTGFEIFPQVGIFTAGVEELNLRPNPSEVDKILTPSLYELVQPNVFKQEMFKVGSAYFPIEVFDWRQNRIWGATGAMLANFLRRIGKVIESE